MILGVLSLVSEKLALCMAEGYSVKLEGIGTFNAKSLMVNDIFMRVPDYVSLTGLSRSTAAEELRKLATNPSSGIMSRGSRSQKVYVLRPNAI